MNIAHHLSQLLYRYQCVTVPGFGAFLTETIPANIQESNQTFYPPKKVISFNSYLKNNDGLLANHIAISEKMSYDLAVASIEKEVSLWKLQLESNENLNLKNIGELKLNDEKSLVFESSKDFNYLTNSFGLSSFVSPLIKREVLNHELKKLGETPVVTLLPEIETAKRSYLKYAAVFVMSIGAATFGYKSYIMQTEQSETLIVQAQVQKEVESKIQEATFFIGNPLKTESIEVKEEKLPFHIVAGAFRNEKNAEKVLDNLTNQGYKAKILDKNKNGLYPVLYGSFATYTEAQYKMTEIQKTINQDAWLLIEEI
jgi:predicted peroxiredoxin